MTGLGRRVVSFYNDLKDFESNSVMLLGKNTVEKNTGSGEKCHPVKLQLTCPFEDEDHSQKRSSGK